MRYMCHGQVTWWLVSHGGGSSNHCGTDSEYLDPVEWWSRENFVGPLGYQQGAQFQLGQLHIPANSSPRFGWYQKLSPSKSGLNGPFLPSKSSKQVPVRRFIYCVQPGFAVKQNRGSGGRRGWEPYEPYEPYRPGAQFLFRWKRSDVCRMRATFFLIWWRWW